MIVLDASVVLEMLLRTPAAAGVEARLFQPGETLHAPHLIDVEIAQVLRRYESSRQATAMRCREALDDWQAVTVHRYAHEVLLTRVWDLRSNLTAYDAAYVALAEALGAPLVTCDARIARTPGHGAAIELLAP